MGVCNDNGFCQKIQLGASGRESGAAVSFFQNTPEKLILKSIFPLKVAATLLTGSKGYSRSIVITYSS